MCDLNNFIEAEVNNLIVCENTQNVFKYDHKKVKEFINYMMVQELNNANNKFPSFQSRHEAYGLMLEEFEEAREEFDDVFTGINEDYWKFCRTDKVNNSKELDNLLKCLEASINCNIKELIQLGAMVKKAKMLEFEKRNDKK